MGIFASYSPGASQAEVLANMNDGYVVTGPGPQAATPIGAADTVTVHNISAEHVRGTIVPVPAFAVTFTGNLSFVIAPGAAFQESFARNAIQSINFIAVDMPALAGVTPVSALTGNGNVYQVIVKFLEA